MQSIILFHEISFKAPQINFAPGPLLFGPALTAHSEQSTWRGTRRVDQPAVYMPMMRPLSNSLNCEKCLLKRYSLLTKVLLESECDRHVYESSTMRRLLQGSLPDFRATAECVVMRIGTKLVSFAYFYLPKLIEQKLLK
ncbi:hypothetical protein AVEN_244530-1 [Araneus ventricosus]|uniref:Uncharacterized protein n=1 Tax=Araneus ventricosus TaxID=182803 RepID=A0A4Y2F5N1_ARAVE|nr:hypothetical protein AVEN_244530-1 [Araneus ventricosus]